MTACPARTGWPRRSPPPGRRPISACCRGPPCDRTGPYPYGPRTVYRETLTPSPYFEGGNLVFPRAVLERTGGFDESFGFSGEDTAAGWAAIEDGGRWLFDETCAVTHDIVERPLRWHLMMAWREGNLVDVAVRSPRAARARGSGDRGPIDPGTSPSLSGWSATVVGMRWRPALLAWVPWLVLRRPPLRSGPRATRSSATGRWLLNDVVVLGGMLRASIRNRTLVL